MTVSTVALSSLTSDLSDAIAAWLLMEFSIETINASTANASKNLSRFILGSFIGGVLLSIHLKYLFASVGDGWGVCGGVMGVLLF